MNDTILQRLWQRLQATLATGRIFLTDDTGPIQTAQMRTGPGELVDGVPVLRHYGFTSRPPAETLGVAIFANGDRNAGVIVGTNHPASRRKNLQPGEAALYDDQGRHVWIKRDVIEIEAGDKPVHIKGATTVTIEAATEITLDTPLVKCTGDVEVDGEVTASGVALSTHTHGGVEPGGGNTGAPN